MCYNHRKFTDKGFYKYPLNARDIVDFNIVTSPRVPQMDLISMYASNHKNVAWKDVFLENMLQNLK